MKRYGLRIDVAVALVLAVCPGIGSRCEQAERASKKSATALWADLASKDEATALGALLELAALPDDAMPLLKKDLRPVLIDPRRAARWLADLDSERFADRQNATEEFLHVGPYAEPYLRKALEGKPSLEVRRRIEQILGKIAQPRPGADWPRVARGLALLEHYNAVPSRQLLEQLSKGRSKAPITQEAEAAVDRLDVQLTWPPSEQVQALRQPLPGPVARAALALAASPQQTLAHLEKASVEVPAPPPMFAKRITSLIEDLTSRKNVDRKEIRATLRRFGIMARGSLYDAMHKQKTTLARMELLDLMKPLEADWRLREEGEGVDIQLPMMSRLSTILQHVGTPKARELDDALRQGKRLYEPISLVLTSWSTTPDGKGLATVGSDGTVCLWDTAKAELEWWTDPRGKKVVGIRFSKDSKVALVDFADQLTQVYNVESGKLTAEFLRVGE
ncbi:MAG: WD40 repeat domain-containing protein [Gemmataceae bacterium]|nr:WD40 repeat domain-containing protein [Gemmataceae bacterium]